MRDEGYEDDLINNEIGKMFDALLSKWRLALDKSFDKFEVYALKNILLIPNDIVSVLMRLSVCILSWAVDFIDIWGGYSTALLTNTNCQTPNPNSHTHHPPRNECTRHPEVRL